MNRFGYLAFAIVAAACSAKRQPVRMVGPAGDIATLAGEWSGDYSSAESGRRGTISFTLRAQGDSAFGDVVMVPAGWGRPLTPWRDPSAQQGSQGANAPAAVLTINFVRVQGAQVSGTLAPYADPSTGARLLTTFTGNMSGATIDGTYTTRLPSGETQQGRWTVQRR
jgi:hypothetical protein